MTLIIAMTGIIGYVWMWFNIWPVTGGHTPLTGWLGSAVLCASAVLSYPLRARYLHFAYHLLIWSTLLAVSCSTLAFPLPALNHLFLLPILFAYPSCKPRRVLPREMA